MKKINKILPILSLFLLSSCNTQSETKEYDYNNYDEDRILVKDFTLNNARICARSIRRYRNNTSCFGIDIFYYLGKYSTEKEFYISTTGYIIIAREFDPLFNMLEYASLAIPYEVINGKEYSWTKESTKCNTLVPAFVNKDTVYSLKEAYNLNYITEDNLLNISDLYFNHLEECKVNIRFISYNSL